MNSVADMIAAGLRAAGIDRIFGLPGGENVELLDALRRAGLTFVVTHHEASAVFMADTWARLTGRPGACLTTLGPGATNAVAGVAHACLDRGPVLVLTAQLPAALRPHHTHQFVDLQALFAPITKASFEATTDNAADLVPLAVRHATTGRPAPVHIQVSNDIAARPSTQAAPTPLPPPAPPRPPNLAPLLPLLARSRHPLIVAGLGLEPERPYEALRALAEAAAAPVVTTPKAKGALPDDHPLAAGTIGLTRTDPTYALLDEADCLLAIGFDVVELVKPWQQAGPLTWLAPWPNEDPRLPTAFEAVGPLAEMLQFLSTISWSTEPGWGAARVAAHRAQQTQSLPPPAAGRMHPHEVLTALRQVLPRDAIVTVDVGSHKILASLRWPTYASNTFFVSNGLSSMGFGLPAAIAASMAHPERAVVCLTGDAGLAMVLGELALLARYRPNVIVVVFHDAALDLIRSHQRRAGKPVYGTEFTTPSFTGVSAAYGLAAYHVTSAATCAEAAATALAAGGPALIEAMIDPAAYPTTPGQA